MNAEDESCSPDAPETDYLTVVLRNSRTAIILEGDGPVLLRSFVSGDEWQDIISNLASALHSCDGVDIRFIGEGIDPWGTPPDDVEARRDAESATIIATYEGDRLGELRSAVQESLHLSRMPNCWLLHTGSTAMEVVYSGGHTVANLEGLLHAKGCDTPEELVDHLHSQTDRDAWIDWESSDGRILTVCVGRHGIELEYPFTMDEFRSAVFELDGVREDD